MHREGHVGLNLLLYVPVASVLTWVGFITPMAWGLLGMTLMSTAPDIDLYTPWFRHRGITHTVFAALFVGLLFGGMGVVLAYYGFGRSLGVASIRIQDQFVALAAGGAFGGFIGTFAIVAHLVGDAFTPRGTRPWQPVSDRRHSLNWFNADNHVANKMWLVLGTILLVVGVTIGAFLRAGIIVIELPSF